MVFLSLFSFLEHPVCSHSCCTYFYLVLLIFSLLLCPPIFPLLPLPLFSFSFPIPPRMQVRSILEDLDDAEYYGSDHEEREKGKKDGGANRQETVEEELARLVSWQGTVYTPPPGDDAGPRGT